jgi:hypothetical protein
LNIGQLVRGELVSHELQAARIDPELVGEAVSQRLLGLVVSQRISIASTVDNARAARRQSGPASPERAMVVSYQPSFKPTTTKTEVMMLHRDPGTKRVLENPSVATVLPEVGTSGARGCFAARRRRKPRRPRHVGRAWLLHLT